MNPSITKSSARWFAVVVVVVTAAVAFVGFTALQVPGMGLDEGAHITHAEKLRQGHLASHDDMMSPELSSAIRCERYRAWGSGLNPGYPSGAHYECYSPAQLKKGNNEFAAQQAQHTPVYYLPLALATKVVDKVTDLDPLVDTYRVAGLIFTALTTASLLILALKLRISPWIGAACTLAVIGTSGFIYAHAFVNNDALAIPGGVAMLLAARRVDRGRASVWLLFAVSFAVALAKPTFLAAQLAAMIYLLQGLRTSDTPLIVALRADGAARVRWVRGTFGRLAPLIATLGGLALGTMAWQLWIQRMVPGSRSNFTEFYKTRVFQADYFKDVVNNLQNPLTQERPISIMDPSYGLFAMSLLEATFLWGTVLVAFGLFRRRAGEAARLARSGVSAIVVGAVVLFAYAAARGYGVSSANTRYLLPAVPFMFGAIALSIDHLWEQHLRRIPKGLLTALVAVMLLLEGVAVSHTPDPRLNNAWTRRQTGVLASFINEDVASTKPCIHKGDTVIVVPFMPALYSMTPEIEPPENASDYWVTSLPREVRKAPYDTIEGSDVDVVITSSPLRVAYERTAVARVQSSWTQCALWQPIGLGLSHPPFEVFVRP